MLVKIYFKKTLLPKNLKRKEWKESMTTRKKQWEF
jgi:hypothetical protein